MLSVGRTRVKPTTTHQQKKQRSLHTQQHRPPRTAASHAYYAAWAAGCAVRCNHQALKSRETVLGLMATGHGARGSTWFAEGLVAVRGSGCYALPTWECKCALQALRTTTNNQNSQHLGSMSADWFACTHTQRNARHHTCTDMHTRTCTHTHIATLTSSHTSACTTTNRHTHTLNTHTHAHIVNVQVSDYQFALEQVLK